MSSPTFNQIKAYVTTIRRKVPEARVIGIRTSGRWTGERLKRDGAASYFIEQCDSPLEMRIALREEIPAEAMKVLITSLAEQELGDDVLMGGNRTNRTGREQLRRTFAAHLQQCLGAFVRVVADSPLGKLARVSASPPPVEP